MAMLFLLLLFLGVNCGLSARIAGFTAVGGSQYINMRHVLEELASRGHEVMFYIFFLSIKTASLSLHNIVPVVESC